MKDFLIVLDEEGMWSVADHGGPLPEGPAAFVPVRCSRTVADICALELNGSTSKGLDEDVKRRLASIQC